MIEYEISYETYEDLSESEIYDEEPEEEEYEMVISEESKRWLAYTLKRAEYFAKLWRGKMIVSYDENKIVRDYTMRIIVDEVNFYNAHIDYLFSDMLSNAAYVTIRPYAKNRNKVELVVIQSNANKIFLRINNKTESGEQHSLFFYTYKYEIYKIRKDYALIFDK